MSDPKDYSVSCLTYAKDLDDIKGVREWFTGEIRDLGYDTLSSFKKRYDENDKMEKEYSFLRKINPFAKDKTRKERFFFTLYFAPLAAGLVIDAALSFIGVPTENGGTIEGAAINGATLIMAEYNRRANKNFAKKQKEFINEKLFDPKTSFFSDLLEQKTNVSFTFVTSAGDVIEKAKGSGVFAKPYHEAVNKMLISEYLKFANQTKT